MMNIRVFVCLSTQGSKIGQCSSRPRWSLQAGRLRHVQRGHNQRCVHRNLLWDARLHCPRGQFPHSRYIHLGLWPTATADDRHFTYCTCDTRRIHDFKVYSTELVQPRLAFPATKVLWVHMMLFLVPSPLHHTTSLQTKTVVAAVIPHSLEFHWKAADSDHKWPRWLDRSSVPRSFTDVLGFYNEGLGCSASLMFKGCFFLPFKPWLCVWIYERPLCCAQHLLLSVTSAGTY